VTFAPKTDVCLKKKPIKSKKKPLCGGFLGGFLGVLFGGFFIANPDTRSLGLTLSHVLS
jgi:hypothetical protein